MPIVGIYMCKKIHVNSETETIIARVTVRGCKSGEIYSVKLLMAHGLPHVKCDVFLPFRGDQSRT